MMIGIEINQSAAPILADFKKGWFYCSFSRRTSDKTASAINSHKRRIAAGG